jgi:hypothetical protein
LNLELAVGGLTLVVGLLMLVWLAILFWSLAIILTTPQQEWDESGMSQLAWLAVVILVPLVGAPLFLLVGRTRLGRSVDAYP